MTTGATLSGPSLASWFLDRKLGEGYKDTLHQFDWCLMLLCSQAWISLLHLPESRASRKTVLKVNALTRPLLKVQREPLSAGVRPGTGSRRVYPGGENACTSWTDCELVSGSMCL